VSIKMGVSQLFSQPLQQLAEGTLRRFTRGQLAGGPRTVAKSGCRRSPLSGVDAREPRNPAGSAYSGKGPFARCRLL